MRLALLDWDFQIFSFFNGLAGHSPAADSFFVFLAQGIIFLMIAGLALFLFLEKKRGNIRAMQVLESLVAGFLGRAVFVTLIRIFFPRPRPFITATVNQLVMVNPAEWSFPSAHATIMFALAFSLLPVSKPLALTYFILALVSSLARIVVGVHYPLDILGGMLVGAFSAFLAHALFGFLARRKNKNMV